MKVCKTCGRNKEINEFPRDRTKKGKRHSQCKECKNKKARERYHRNKKKCFLAKFINFFKRK